jgi:hypothetical protein
LEAKCLSKSNTATIHNAHAKLVAGGLRPSGVRELINLLQEYETPNAEKWQHALLHFYREGFKTAVRHDGLTYAVGNSPIIPRTKIGWLPPNAPHPAYTLQRNLEAMEFQFENLNDVIDILYRGA